MQRGDIVTSVAVDDLELMGCAVVSTPGERGDGGLVYLVTELGARRVCHPSTILGYCEPKGCLRCCTEDTGRFMNPGAIFCDECFQDLNVDPRVIA